MQKIIMHQCMFSKYCSKCLQSGLVFSECVNDSICKNCKQGGHKMSECSIGDVDYSQESDHDSDHSDAQEMEPTGQSSDEEHPKFQR